MELPARTGPTRPEMSFGANLARAPIATTHGVYSYSAFPLFQRLVNPLLAFGFLRTEDPPRASRYS